LIEKKVIHEEERAILVGLVTKDQTETQTLEYLTELAFLAETAGAVPIKQFIQKLPHRDSKTFVGKGKLEEIHQYAISKNVNLLVFDDELTGSQIINIEKATGVKTIDRSDLILDIFARRAQTAQAKVQVSWPNTNTCCPALRACGNT
jgi:GTP-binding protein HflX